MLFLPAVETVFSRAVLAVMLAAKILIGPAILVLFAVVVVPVIEELLRVTSPPV